jgi:purine-cytosine permease-like protein
VAVAEHPGDLLVVDERNRRFGVETNGINFIGERERLMGQRELSTFWIASSFYPFNLLLGILVYGLGLPLWATIVVVAGIGFAAYFYVGLASIPGARSGISTQALTRVTFGINGNRVNALFAWVTGIAYEIINVVTGVLAGAALFHEMGWHSAGHGPTIVALVVVYGFSILLPYLGHATVIYVQQAFAVILAIASAAIFISLVPHLDLSARVHGTGISFASGFFIGCGIVISGAWGYVMMAADYPRYMPSKTSGKKIFWNVLFSAGAPAAFLGLVGVLMASRGNLTALTADPVGGSKGELSTAIFVIWILAAIGGSIANNALTLYSAGLAAQALGLPVKRYQATIIDACIATVGIIYILFFDNGGFLAWLNSAVVFSVAWLGPFGAIWLTDLAWRKWTALPEEVHGGRASPFWGISGARRVAWPALILGMFAAMMCISVPKYTGPVAAALGNTDFSWLAGPLVGGLIYFLLARRTVAREVAGRHRLAPPPESIDSEEAYSTGVEHLLRGGHAKV